MVASNPKAEKVNFDWVEPARQIRIDVDQDEARLLGLSTAQLATVLNTVLSGTPVTQVDMRRIVDGVKVSERWRTTEQVERAHVDERGYDFLYEDGEGFHFMEPETYEQVVAPADMVGEQKAYLQEGMRVFLQVYDGAPIAMELPQKITVEVTESGRAHV